ncbi:ABC transporter ATP-binding protein, partial [bacterium]|nr:ABC transporter ATP-binding protein [bacterium]
MLRLIKYLKPYLFNILLAIALLFVMANADLALPDYLSKIVNNGIQQGGIENAVPVAIRQSQMDKVTLFMSESDKTLVMGDYTLIDTSSADYATYVAEYPALATEPVYVLKAVDAAEFENLKPILAKAQLVVSFIQQLLADPTKAAAMLKDTP